MCLSLKAQCNECGNPTNSLALICNFSCYIALSKALGPVEYTGIILFSVNYDIKFLNS